MFNVAFLVIVLLLGLMSVNSMSIKRSAKQENNLEKVDETEYPIKVNYDVYPVRKNNRQSFNVQQVGPSEKSGRFGFEFHVGGEICVTVA